MPDPYSIPFKQADGNGHYKSKELPDNKEDFLGALGVPQVFGDVLTGETSTVNNQLTVWYGTDGHTIKAVPTTTSGITVVQSGVATFEPHPAGSIVGTDAVQTLTNKTFGTGITFGSGVTFTGGVSGLTKSDVGLSNVDNTSDAQKNSAVATLTNKTISTPTINSPTFSGTVTGLTKASVGLSNVDNTSDLNKPLSTADTAALALKQDLSGYNTANGYAPLGSDSKVPLANLPDAVLGASKYQGTWNATTNIPPIPPAAPSNNGNYYVVNTAGNTSIDGINVWAVGDWVISNGTYWQKIPNTNAVTSVNAKTGAVVLNKADVGLSAVDNTSDAAKNSAAATLTNKTINGASNTLTVRLDADVVNNLPVSRLNGGTGASAATFWRGDGLWVSPTGAGDVQGPSASVDGEVTVFSGTTGKQLRVFGGAAGFAKVGPGTALTTTPTIGALDVNPSLVHGQTQKTSTDGLDELLVWDNTSNTLKSMRYSTAISGQIWAVRQRSYNAVGNPNFEIDQKLTGGVLPTSGTTWAMDRWLGNNTTGVAPSLTQTALSVDVPGTSFRITNSVVTLDTKLTTKPSLAAGDVLQFSQSVEGLYLRELIDDVHSVSILARTNVSGGLKFALSLRDNGNTRSLVKLCTIPTANTWTLLQFPALPIWDAGGTFPVVPGSVGCTLTITAACGTTNMTPANDAWRTGNFVGAVGMDNILSKPSNSTLQLAFVQHEPGPDCTGLIDVPWTANLDGCVRYFDKSYEYGTKYGAATGVGCRGFILTPGNTQWAGGACDWSKPMATVPTVNLFAQDGTQNAVTALGIGTWGYNSLSGIGSKGFYAIGFSAAMTAGTLVSFQYRADTSW